MRKVKKFETGGSANDYKGTDEIVQYRMGQIKDPGVDLFKLARGEEQEAKPVPLARKAEPAKPAETKPAEAETKTASTKPERIFNETGTEFFRNPESGALYNLEPKPEDSIRKPAAKIAKAAKPAAAAAPAVKTETKVEAKDDKPVAKKLTDEEKFDAEVKRLRLENVNKPYPKKKSFLEDLKDKFGGKKVSGAKPSSDKDFAAQAIKRGGVIKKMAGGGKVKSASARADGCAIRGKTRA